MTDRILEVPENTMLALIDLAATHEKTTPKMLQDIASLCQDQGFPFLAEVALNSKHLLVTTVDEEATDDYQKELDRSEYRVSIMRKGDVMEITTPKMSFHMACVRCGMEGNVSVEPVVGSCETNYLGMVTVRDRVKCPNCRSSNAVKIVGNIASRKACVVMR